MCRSALIESPKLITAELLRFNFIIFQRYRSVLIILISVSTTAGTQLDLTSVPVSLATHLLPMHLAA